MPRDAQGKLIHKVLAILVILIGVMALCPRSAHSQGTAKRLSKQDVLDLLTGDVPSERVAAIAKEKGISFEMTGTVERDIRAAGGSDDLIRALRGLAPRAPSAPAQTPRTSPTAVAPPVLMIRSNPGESQVYIDDEPMGSTSQAGRLKLTRLSPGEHQVRISLSGYQDHEETVELAGGQTATVTARLQAVAPPPTYSPPQHPTEPETPPVSSGQAGYLGVEPMAQQPAGARGVVISGAAPGSPADQAGIKTYDTILAVDGRPVRTTQELVSMLTSHQAGDVVPVTWYNGSTNVTRRIRLAAQTSQPPAETATPSYPPSLTNMPQTGFVSFPVAHDHGQGGSNYCVGVMSIGNGMIYYRSTNGLHNFEIPLNTVREARRNAVYLSALGAFHIRLSKGANYNFVALNQYGQYQPPDAILTAIDKAMGK
jgi:hypothetical protein